MPYHMDWLVEKRVIYMVQYGVVNADEMRESFDRNVAMIESGIPRVHMIVNGIRVERSEMGLKDIQTMFKSHDSSPNFGWSVYVTANRLNRFLASIATQFTHANSREFATLEEGVEFLHKQDPSLPPFSVDDLKAWEAEHIAEQDRA